MAQWTQTLEPYIKVQEEIKTTTLTPTAGESLIIGVALISDAGPSTPTLISSQKEFLSTYASQDLTQEYIESLNNLYSGDDATTAATMWANAYRLAGSNTLLVTRATKADNIFFSKPLVKGDQNTYILRDGELLKKISSGFKMVLDDGGDLADHDTDGWSINISGVGIFGNRTTDEGAQYDYYVDNLPDLVEALNETTKFFSPKYTFYRTIEDSNNGDIYNVDMDNLNSKKNAKVVIFEEVYLGYEILDKTDPRTAPALQEAIEVTELPEPDASIEGNIYLDTTTNKYYVCRYNRLTSAYEFDLVKENMGLMYIVTCQVDGSATNMNQKVIDLNGPGYSNFTPSDYYATNIYNSATELKVRIRRFNHDAVTSKSITDTSSLTAKSNSPYTVLTSVLDTFTGNGLQEPNESILERDFFEVAVWDPSVNNTVSFFNIGNLLGRGDMEVSELNSLISMIQLNLPDDLHDLKLNYYDYKNDDYIWVRDEDNEDPIPVTTIATYEDLLAETGMVPGDTRYVDNIGWFKFSANGDNQLFADLTIDPMATDLISVSDSDLKKALDLIALDEVYTTEGLCDLGNTELSYQNYMANMAINDNYFYPISTVNSTNYMTIGNSSTKISQDSCKLYMSAPWDIDTGNLGWKYYASPSVLFWEAVARNRRNNNEFASVFGQSTGVVNYQRPVVEFNKKTRQLLLSRKVNTALWNISTQAWNMNDSYTKQSENNILGEDGNSRLMIRISKAMPVLLKQFIGKKITAKLCEEVRFVIDYYFKTVILPMNYTVEAYNIICNYDEILARQNKIKVKVQSRFMRSLKFIDVYDQAYDVGMSFETE
jgi:hypothetical protein